MKMAERPTRYGCEQVRGGRRAAKAAYSRAFTMVEVVISAMIVATMVVAAMNAAGVAYARRAKTLWRIQGQQLASALMSEILAMPYQDPNPLSVHVAIELGDTVADRTAFDNIDDFNGYTQTPPRALDGTILMTDANWSWRALVERVDPAKPGGGASLSETGAKRITVTVERHSVPVAVLVGLRTNID